MDTLNIRIIEMMAKLELNKSAFAKELNVSMPLVTHITSGRNKPGIDIIQKLLLKFEKINPDWLLTGTGEMFRKPPQKSDFTDIFNKIDTINNQLSGQKNINKTIKSYHKILVDEIKHLEEMTSIIENSSQEINEIKLQLEDIKSQINSHL